MMAASTPETAIQNDYRARVAFYASRERVFDAIATVEGVRRWWMPIVKGCAATGGELRLEFEGLDEQIVLRVADAQRPSLIQVVMRSAHRSPGVEWHDDDVRDRQRHIE